MGCLLPLGRSGCVGCAGCLLPLTLILLGVLTPFGLLGAHRRHRPAAAPRPAVLATLPRRAAPAGHGPHRP